jgi:hypothetical protein
MKQLVVPAMLGSLVFLASCSSKDELVFCPSLSAPVEGARAFVVTDEQEQTVDVRLNGVRAQCTAEADGSILMEVKVGLKMTRNLAQNASADIAIVPMMTAILDANDEVLSNEAFGYKTGFNTDLARLLPVVELELVVPADGRAVISLTPTR